MHSFSALLDTLNSAPPDRKPAVQQLILDAFQRRKAVLALDMSGFTLTVRRDGILAYLCQIRRMQQITTPIVLAHQGSVVKNEADNLLVVFDDAQQAVRAALAMLQSAASASGGVIGKAMTPGMPANFGNSSLAISGERRVRSFQSVRPRIEIPWLTVGLPATTK